MTIKRTVAGLTHGVSAAVSLARHPLSTAANAAGLVKGTVQTAHGLVKGRTAEETREAEADSAVPEAPVEDSVEVPVEETVESHEPQVVLKPVPTIDELPEPIVIYADDAADESAPVEEPSVSESDEPEAEVVWTSESTEEPQADRA